jgi:hypothetical protein
VAATVLGKKLVGDEILILKFLTIQTIFTVDTVKRDITNLELSLKRAQQEFEIPEVRLIAHHKIAELLESVSYNLIL